MDDIVISYCSSDSREAKESSQEDIIPVMELTRGTCLDVVLAHRFLDTETSLCISNILCLLPHYNHSLPRIPIVPKTHG